MRQRKSRFKSTSIILVGVFFFVLAILCVSSVLAKTNGNEVYAPEPGSMILVGGGLIGMIVRFARKRFQEFKRIFDILAASALILIASPILFVAIVLIKIVSPGSVIYRQERVGKDGSTFKIYKLRTMKLDAEKDTGPVWAKAKDPRLIKFGGILRKAHIDEIPQLFNVLKGQMSIIGPRPERPEFVRDLRTVIRDYEKRLAVKPGITGLAQVFHKYDETIADVKKKIKFDLLYIRKMCWFVDLRILAQTFIVVLTGRGAR